jgi:hypothetical protein
MWRIITQRQKFYDFIEEIVLHSFVKAGLWKCSGTEAIQLC